ncbi:hypothetical protein GGR12_003044 [Brevundimonas lenta]|uniref:Uncharacterized protein n=1 Tax=Brevundimonas lenta TaxID=424796 RepID=A0A7W6JFI8_9CAUL|nr:hypothetical protein [Brevundimonas lenta]
MLDEAAFCRDVGAGAGRINCERDGGETGKE